jgi:hypothetical protein
MDKALDRLPQDLMQASPFGSECYGCIVAQVCVERVVVAGANYEETTAQAQAVAGEDSIEAERAAGAAETDRFLYQAAKQTMETYAKVCGGPTPEGACTVARTSRRRGRLLRAGKAVLGLAASVVLVGGYMAFEEQVDAAGWDYAVDAPDSKQPVRPTVTPTQAPNPSANCLAKLTKLTPEACASLPPLPYSVVELPQGASLRKELEDDKRLACNFELLYEEPKLLGLMDPTTGVANLSGLPPDYQKAFELALGQPAQAYLLQHVPKIAIWYSPNGENAAFFSGGPTSERIDVCIGGPGHDLFTTFAELQATVFHEGVHALHDDWRTIAEKEGQAETQALLEDLTESCRADLEYVSEQFRIKQGPEVVTKLRSFRESLQGRGNAKAVRMVDWIIERFETEEGLRDVAVHKYKRSEGKPLPDNEQYQGVRLGQYFDAAAEALGLEKKNGDFALVDWTSFDEAEEMYDTFFEAAYMHADEAGATANGLRLNPGHPTGNVDEFVASLLDSVQLNPEGTIQRIHNLNPQRRERAIQQLDFLRRLIVLNDAELLSHTNVGYVLNRLGALHPRLAAGNHEYANPMGVGMGGTFRPIARLELVGA